MISAPWSVLLTLAFAIITVIGAVGTASVDRRHGHLTAGAAAAERLVHLNHLVMGLMMILMVWRPSGTAGSWIQSGLFLALAVGLLFGIRSRTGVTDRIGQAAHAAMNFAMIWMLLAMPLLMGSPAAGADGHGAHGSGAGEVPAPTGPTPPWVTAVDGAAIALGSLLTLWWVGRLLRGGGPRVDLLCHAAMCAGMTAMLALM